MISTVNDIHREIFTRVSRKVWLLFGEFIRRETFLQNSAGDGNFIEYVAQNHSDYLSKCEEIINSGQYKSHTMTGQSDKPWVFFHPAFWNWQPNCVD